MAKWKLAEHGLSIPFQPAVVFGKEVWYGINLYQRLTMNWAHGNSTNVSFYFLNFPHNARQIISLVPVCCIDLPEQPRLLA